MEANPADTPEGIEARARLALWRTFYAYVSRLEPAADEAAHRASFERLGGVGARRRSN